MVKLTVNEENAVLVKMKSGKPGKSETRNEQKAQKGPLTCVYYSLNRIRDRHKHETIRDQNRESEELISRHRKQLTSLSDRQAIEGKFFSCINSMQSYMDYYKYPSRIENLLEDNGIEDQLIDEIFKDYQKYKNISASPSLSTIEKVQIMLKDANIETFSDERYKKQLYSTFLKMCKDYEIDINQLAPGFEIESNWFTDEIEKLLQRAHKGEQVAIPDLDFKSFNLNVQMAVLYNLITNVQAKHYGLQVGSLNCKSDVDDIDGMIELIKKHGAVVVGGTIGLPFYKENSEKVKKVGERTFYGFPPNTAIERDFYINHAVTIVGASKKGYCGEKQDLIYYIDPMISSSPDSPQKIFVMSYDNFKKKVQKDYYTVENNIIKKQNSPFFFKPEKPQNSASANTVANVATEAKGSTSKAMSICKMLSVGLTVTVTAAAIATTFALKS